VQKIELALVISYLLMTCYFFSRWLRFSLRHPSSSPEDKFLSLVMFFISTALWPLLFPISCLKIIKRRELEFSAVFPVILAAFAFSLSFYLS
jgi:hypothetical protein